MTPEPAQQPGFGKTEPWDEKVRDWKYCKDGRKGWKGRKTPTLLRNVVLRGIFLSRGRKKPEAKRRLSWWTAAIRRHLGRHRAGGAPGQGTWSSVPARHSAWKGNSLERGAPELG